MSVITSSVKDKRATALLRIAAYLSQPQQFMAVADARAEMRRTLEMVTKGSVVLTTHGEPEAAVVPFTTLEDMRRALMQLMVSEMEASFARTQEQAHVNAEEVVATSDEELESLVGEAIRVARRKRRDSSERKASRR
jgi:antitoxin (DNA-binding transcriptional repressor) of toxin-antitoxin stability system